MKNSFLIFVLCVCLWGCQTSNTDTVDRFSDYLSSTFNINLVDGLYVILPEHSCSGCKKWVLRTLSSKTVKGNVNLISVGVSQQASLDSFLGRIEVNGTVVIKDESGTIFEYGLIESNYPKEYIRFIEVTDSRITLDKSLKTEDLASNQNLLNYFNEHLNL